MLAFLFSWLWASSGAKKDQEFYPKSWFKDGVPHFWLWWDKRAWFCFLYPTASSATTVCAKQSSQTKSCTYFWSGSSSSVKVGGSWLNWAGQGPFLALLLSHLDLVLNVVLGKSVPHGPGLLQTWHEQLWPKNPPCSPGMVCVDPEPCVSTSQTKYWAHPWNFASKMVPVQRLEQQHHSTNLSSLLTKLT